MLKYGVGVGGYKYKNLIINAQNSGTLGRLIAGILIDTPYPIKSSVIEVYQRFQRIAKPLSKFGLHLNLIIIVYHF